MPECESIIYVSFPILYINVVSEGDSLWTSWIVNTFLDNFYKDNPKRYATVIY